MQTVTAVKTIRTEVNHIDDEVKTLNRKDTEKLTTLSEVLDILNQYRNLVSE